MPTLSPRGRRSVWLRQFLIQGCWNFEGMQNVGFAYAILPALREFYSGRPEEALKAVKRHLEFFNTHPAMGGVILGAAVRHEERVAAGEADPRAIGAFKVGLMGSLGAIGDAFFWGALRPVASAAGAILALVHPMAGIAVLLVLYNATHLPVRFRGFRAGMEGQEGAVAWLRKAELNVKTEDRKMMAAILGGAYAGAFMGRHAVLGGTGLHAVALFLIAAAAVHLFTVLFRKAVSPSELISFLLLVGVLILWQ
ncbi:MAG: PTS mannose transporter subunit IID [Deltaproteobacteria bacterium]|nr:MAG: PTS mannose transporter subunit IID [Deltaproteobacteria bacterium]